MRYLLQCLLLATLSLNALTTSAQLKKKVVTRYKPIVNAPTVKTYVIKGKVKNYPETSWSYFSAGLFKGDVIDVPLKSDGSFYKVLNITTPVDIGLYVGDGLSLYACAGDTLTLDWDNKDLDGTFIAKVNSPERQKQLDLIINISKHSRKHVMDVQKAFGDKNILDSVKYNKVRDNFTAEIKMVGRAPITEGSKKVVYDIYFNHKSLLTRLNRTAGNNYQLPLKAALPEGTPLHSMFGKEFFDPESWGYVENLLDERLFYVSSEYRDFISSKIESDRSAFSSVTYDGGPREDSTPNYTLYKCYAAISKLSLSPLIRDWFITKIIMEGFNYYDFGDVEDAYKKMSADIRVPEFKAELTSYYAAMHSLKPGMPAPVFKLKNIEGKTVSLSDFKGKVVYIDFWGVSCPPCIGDIKSYGAKFHDKYKAKGVVFLNICVDSEEAEWRKSVADLKLDGINLMAASVNDPACKAYHINGIPHYIIVDADGNIVNNNAPRMGELLGNGVSIKRDKDGNNELDTAISKAQ